MKAGRCQSLVRLWRREQGGAAVEMAIVLVVLLLLLFGIVDFGHAWYMDHLCSNASREGARYGTRFTGTLPQNLNPSISNYIKDIWGLIRLLPPDANPQVNATGPGMIQTKVTDLTGKDITVTVTARKTWFVIGHLVPGLGSYKDITVSTTMKHE